MNISFLQDAGIDYTAGIQRFMGDVALYQTILTMFFQDDCLARAETAYAQGDNDALLTVAHEVKGSSGNADMTRLYHASCDLVDLLRKNPTATTKDITPTYESFRRAYLATLEGIRKALED